MKQELMQTNGAAGEYLAPKIKVKELRCKRVLCSSIETFSVGSSQGDDDFDNQ